MAYVIIDGKQAHAVEDTDTRQWFVLETRNGTSAYTERIPNNTAIYKTVEECREAIAARTSAIVSHACEELFHGDGTTASLRRTISDARIALGIDKVMNHPLDDSAIGWP